MKKKLIISALLLSISLSVTSCQSEKNENVIYTSFFAIEDLVKRIVGDKYEVRSLTPYGNEPHEYEPKAKDVIAMYDAKAIFFNGLSLEGYYDSLPDKMKEKTVLLDKGITTMTIDKTIDPHIWLSIDNAMKEMETILSTLKDIDSVNAAYYEKNYEVAKSEFSSLQEEYKAKFSNVEKPYLLVSHAAFGYLCRDYHLKQIYVNGISPDNEPTPKALENIIATVRQYDVKVIFNEELASDDVSSLIAKETGCRMDVLRTLEGIEKDEEGKENYLSLMRKNLEKIYEATND